MITKRNCHFNDEIIYIGDEENRIVDTVDINDLKNYPDWQRDIIESAIDIEENWDNYISLPSKFDIDEYDIMTDFCYRLENDKLSSQLLSALNGKGAFRRFKDTVIKLNMEKKWYNFKDEAIKKIAVQWCSDNGIEIINSML